MFLLLFFFSSVWFSHSTAAVSLSSGLFPYMSNVYVLLWFSIESEYLRKQMEKEFETLHLIDLLIDF